jgi:hypothetical protein
MTTYPSISIKNTLAEAVTVFDAFNDNPGDASLANYFGTLTSLGAVATGATASLAPVHGPISTYIVYDSKNNPVKRVFTLGTAPQTFEIGQADLDVITATQNFVALMQTKPADPLVQQFNALIKGGTGTPQAVNTFFANSSDYKTCTFISYMLVVVALARTPATRNLPPAQQGYSLSTLLRYLGIDWPAGLPDIVVSQFTCSDSDDHILLGGQLNLQSVTFDGGVIDRVLSILPDKTVRFTVAVDLEPGLAVGSTQLSCVYDTLSIPVGGGKSVTLRQPTVLLSIMPLFKFVVFEIKATIPFSLFGGPTFDAIAAITVDNVEAEIGVTLDGGTHTLLTPPGIKGLHFDQFGVGMGLFFEPPGFALGVQGKFHIGGGQQVVQLDDDTFALVCALDADVPNPLYLSFYVPQLGLDQVIELFTNQSLSLGFPVDFSDLSFRWAENPMEPVTLPDGTLAPMGYGFSANMNLFGLDLYANLEMDLNNGVQGDAQLSPFSLGPVLSLTGNGTGVSIKVDANGNPIPNNTIPTTAAAKQAIAQARTKQLVRPGGAELHVSTASSPYFTLDAKLAFLGLQDSIDVTIDKSGLSFALDFGGIISGTMACVLRDYQNFSGQFSYGPDYNIPLPTIAGQSLGAIRLTAQVNATLGLTTSASDVVFTAAAGFNFNGQNYQTGPFDLDIHIATLTGVLSAIEQWLLNNAKTVFAELVGDAGTWARAVYSGAIAPAAAGAAYVVGVLKNSFGQTVSQVGDLLKGSSYPLDDVASALQTTFGASASEVADALSTAYSSTANQVAAALQSAGYDAQDAALAISGAFGLAPAAVSSALQGAGYATSAVESAFQTIGGDFASYAESTWDTVTHYANPTNW